MTTYQTIKGSKGSRYLKNGKLVSKTKIPEDIIEALKQSETIARKECVICGSPSKDQRYYNAQTLDTCPDHLDTTLGRFAQLLRERNTPNAPQEI